MKCLICRREIPEHFIEKHHLVPKRTKDTILVCVDCGDQLHVLFTNKELRDQYNTLEKILANDRVQIWINWICKKKEFGICMKRKK